jgi:hypothetical protein
MVAFGPRGGSLDPVLSVGAGRVRGMSSVFDEVFVAGGPRKELAAELGLFAPLIGSWDLRVFDYLPDGEVRESSAEWHFSWALDGRAVADVWINPSRKDRTPEADGEWGLSVRFYDASINAWRSTWHGPKKGLVMPFIARATDDGIELRTEQEGVRHRWTFSDITNDSFWWQREETGADGHAAVRQRFEATRSK